MELLSWGDKGWGDELFFATLMTLAVATAAFLLGLVFGSLGAAAKLSRHGWLRAIADGYTTIMRGVPDLLVIYLFYFGGSALVTYVANKWLGTSGFVGINAFTIGALAIAILSGAYSTEVIRGAVLAIPKGEIEAARAVGMSRLLLFRRILAPQALRYALPGLGNVWQLALKETALISVTGLVEIMRQSTIAAGSTKKPFTFYAAAAVLYLVLTTLSTYAFQRAEDRSMRGMRRA
ncbi:MAG: ABC transporter permease [Alphaproteobacteria bacterium]|nr:ABC transporter permease [Alphaproteobacteria bacterium]